MHRKATLVIIALSIALLATLGYVVYEQGSRGRIDEETQINLPDGEAIVSVSGAKLLNQSSLNVLTLSGMMNVRVPLNRIWPIPDTFMTVRMPFSVEYRLNLESISRRNFDWDQGSRTLNVEVPDVIAAKPNIDEGAISITSPPGVLVTTAEVQKARLVVSKAAEVQASREAAKLERLNEARERARMEVSNLLRSPIEQLGVRRPRIVVTFPYERSGPRERWDQSRSVDQVLTNRY